MQTTGIPTAFARRYLARDPGLLGLGYGIKLKGGRATASPALVFFVRRKRKHPSPEHPFVPEQVLLRSAKRWGSHAGRRVLTDVIEVGPLVPYALGLGDGVRHPHKRARASSSLAALVEESSEPDVATVWALTSAHGVSRRNQLDPDRRCKFRALGTTNDVSGRVGRALLPRRRRTYSDAALCSTEAPITSPLQRGVAEVLSDGALTFEEVPLPRVRERYRARPPSNRGRVIGKIRCLAIGAVIRDVEVPGLGSTTYRNQVVTQRRLGPGDSGTLLVDGLDCPVAMLNGGSERDEHGGELVPVNFFSPMRSVLESLLTADTRRLRFVGTNGHTGT